MKIVINIHDWEDTKSERFLLSILAANLKRYLNSFFNGEVKLPVRYDIVIEE